MLHVIQHSGGDDRIEALGGVCDKRSEVAEQKPGVEPQDLLNDQASEIGAGVRLDGGDVRTGLRQPVSVAALEWPQLQYPPAGYVTKFLQKPGDLVVIEQVVLAESVPRDA